MKKSLKQSEVKTIPSKTITRRRLAECLASLIGSEVKIIYASDPSLRGVRGRVVYETKNTLSIEIDRAKKIKVFKKHIVIEIDCGALKIRAPGSAIIGTIPEKIKRYRKRLKI